MKSKWLGIAIAVCVTLSLIAIPISGCAAPTPTTTPTTPAKPTTPATTPAAPAAPAKVYNLVMASYAPEGYFAYELNSDLKRRIEEESDGRMTIAHYPGDLLGDYTTKAKAVSSGTIDLMVESATQAINPKWEVGTALYLWRNWDDALAGSSPGGWKYQWREAVAPECNWEYLGDIPQGWTGIVSNVQFDPMPGPNGVKVRVMGSKLVFDIMSALGYNPITIPWTEIHSALMLNTIDAAWGTTGAEDFLMFADAYKYAYRLNMNLGFKGAYMNLDFFNSLSSEDQAMIKKVGVEWQEYVFDGYREKNDAVWDEVAKLVQIIDVTDAQWEASAKIAHAIEIPYLEGVLGKEYMDDISEKVGW